jgi:ABC-type phosphate transport system auxiliary subunit
MATKTEKISEETINTIKSFQSDINSLIYTIGQISVKSRELDLELERLSEFKKQTEQKLDNSSLQLENVLSDLQKKYNDAEIDLNEGTVTYQVSE